MTVDQFVELKPASEDFLFYATVKRAHDKGVYLDLHRQDSQYGPADTMAVLTDTMLRELESYEIDPGIQTTLTSPMARWRAASMLQKGIRRGDAQAAKRAGHAMVNHVEVADYALKRMIVIGLEDVACGDLYAAGFACALATAPQFKDPKVRLKALHWLIDRMAGTVKDRAACDLVCWANDDPALKTEAQKQVLMPAKDLQSIAGSKDLPLTHRMIASWLLAGTHRYESNNIPRRVMPKEAWWEWLTAMNPPPLLRFACQVSSEKTRNSLHAALPLIWDHVTRSSEVWVDLRTPPTPETVAGMPGYVLDRYTMEGKRAIAYFAKACDPVREFFAARPHLKPMDVLVEVTFIEEGGCLNQEIGFDTREQMTLDAIAGVWRQVGMTPAEATEIVGIVKMNFEALNRARRKVFEKAA